MSRTPEEKPPVGDSWVDYATRHQHVGAKPCWQCNAREKALAEVEELRRERDDEKKLRLIAGRGINSAIDVLNTRKVGMLESAEQEVAELNQRVLLLKLALREENKVSTDYLAKWRSLSGFVREIDARLDHKSVTLPVWYDVAERHGLAGTKAESLLPAALAPVEG